MADRAKNRRGTRRRGRDRTPSASRSATTLSLGEELREFWVGGMEAYAAGLKAGASLWGRWATTSAHYTQTVAERTITLLRNPRQSETLAADLLDGYRNYLKDLATQSNQAVLDFNATFEGLARIQPEPGAAAPTPAVAGRQVMRPKERRELDALIDRYRNQLLDITTQTAVGINEQLERLQRGVAAPTAT